MPKTPSPFLTSTQPLCPDWLVASGRQLAGEGLTIAIAGGDSLVAVETAQLMLTSGIATPHLIGTPDRIAQHSKTLGLDLNAMPISAADTEDKVMAVAGDLVAGGKVGGLMKGHIHTDRFMLGVLKREHGIRGDGRMVHIFAMFPPSHQRENSQPLLISDAAVNVTPDIKTSQTALQGMCRLAIALGIARPRLAIISATETPIASVPSSMLARELAEWGRENLPEADIAGPLSFDLALSPDAVAIKGLTDPVAGFAHGLLMPDIVAGNVLFKSMVWFSGACAAGVVVGGKVPLMLTSRADPPAARLASIALAAHML